MNWTMTEFRLVQYKRAILPVNINISLTLPCYIGPAYSFQRYEISYQIIMLVAFISQILLKKKQLFIISKMYH